MFYPDRAREGAALDEDEVTLVVDLLMEIDTDNDTSNPIVALKHKLYPLCGLGDLLKEK